MKLIPHNKPSVGNDEAHAVAKVMSKGWLIAGDEVKKFESEIKHRTKRSHAIAVNSGTAALHISLLALGITAKDEVIMPSYTVSDIANAIFYTGAKPVLVDIEKDSFNIDYKQIYAKISRRTKAIVIPHMLGFPAKIDHIRQFGIPIIEDCAQSIGSYYKGKPTGSFGDISVFSFYTSKVITSGQGGMVLTNEKKYFEIMKDLIDYNGRDDYKIRYNYPMTDILAAIGNIQLQKLDSFIKKRAKIAALYQQALDRKNGMYWPKKDIESFNYFRFVIKCKDQKQRDATQKLFNEHNITTIAPYRTTELLHRTLLNNTRDFPISEDIAATTLSLPIYPSLLDSDIKRIVDVLSLLPQRTSPNSA